ncbi:MAG: putative oxidoreductase, aryl-alcohol dehydrogenase like protein [Nonomuraea muscovyensis]|uniref:Aryl-alcohol dehydrogenase-like predicted oxidoreductase n=1 Tax=Nonomuraea muscovyensis TaxID=1124761 RepID=A0A7X0C3G6_9ACTN|nr:aldo/keto reductase [Nonomuraea muscovyensis]MBB6347498.1 aryl-alcohol dehydrogenase-like predicted oxidoreductase [Nonomuraea muscovyensis]MDF2705442.1 putative oxidoreductase, aryl-alcohol dehydrogenase like protein [Nonomuraea muscovyensis]
MRYRLLGRTGLRVSELFFGAMTFYERGGPGALREYRALLDTYADAGGNVIDTASAYGDSEEILGELLDGHRDRFVLASKYTLSRDRRDPNAAGNHRKNLTLTLERSLRRLRTDHLDLYWVHIWDRHTPIEETMRALDDAVRAGKILYVGISDAPAWLVARANTLAEWRDWTPFAALQVPYNLLQRDIERELLPMAEAFGMTVAAWAPLARGVLSGKFTGHPAPPAGRTRVDPASLTARDHAVARTVREVADDLGATPAQVALAWTRTRSTAVHPIVGARDVAQLTDNLGATALTLPEEATRRLEAAAPFEPGFLSDFIAAAEADLWPPGDTAPPVTRR